MNGLEFFSGKRVCVTGATGLIGSYVLKLLVGANADVRACRGKNRLWNYPSNKPCKFDLMQPANAALAVSGCDIVVSCAGITSGIGGLTVDALGPSGPATVLAINILHACVQEHVQRLGFLSSTTVYSEREEPCQEDNLGPEPCYIYRGIGESKRFLEKLHTYYAEKTGLKVAIVRPSGAYGRYDNFNEATSHVIPGMLNRALNLKDQLFEVWGDGTDVRDFIHAEDVARGFLLAVANDVGPVNIASGQGTTTAELAKEVLAAVGSSAPIIFNTKKPTALKKRLVDVRRAKELLGFEPKISLADGLKDTVQWLRSKRTT